jgi:single-strand DNA-binding protein
MLAEILWTHRIKRPLGLGAEPTQLSGAPIHRAERIYVMYQNRLSLIGFSGKEPEQKLTKNGTAYTVLSLATKTSWKNDNDKWESRTEWHRVVAWSKLGEFALSLTKGAHIQVEGELRSREYETDGVKRRMWECRANRIAKLDRIERADDNGRRDEVTDDGPSF